MGQFSLPKMLLIFRNRITPLYKFIIYKDMLYSLLYMCDLLLSILMKYFGTQINANQSPNRIVKNRFSLFSN